MGPLSFPFSFSLASTQQPDGSAPEMALGLASSLLSTLTHSPWVQAT